MAPGDDAPPQSKPPVEKVSGKTTSEVMTRQEMDRQRKEAARLNTGQKLVDGINNIIAVATPAADGCRIIQNAMQLPAEEGLWLIQSINSKNEWDIFNSLIPKYRELYVKKALEAREQQLGLTGEAQVLLTENVQVMKALKGGTSIMGPPSTFQALMKKQARDSKECAHPCGAQSEAMSAN